MAITSLSQRDSWITWRLSKYPWGERFISQLLLICVELRRRGEKMFFGCYLQWPSISTSGFSFNLLFSKIFIGPHKKKEKKKAFRRMSGCSGAGLFIICRKVAQRMRPSVNPGHVSALRSPHARLLFVCNLEIAETDRQTDRAGRTHGWMEPAPGAPVAVETSLRWNARLFLRGKDIKMHLEILLPIFTGFKVEIKELRTQNKA